MKTIALFIITLTIAIFASMAVSKPESQNSPTGTKITKSSQDFSYLVSPAPGSTLSGSSVSFRWTDAGANQYWLDIGSTFAGKNIYSQTQNTSLSTTVNNLPVDGSTLYIRLWTIQGDHWAYVDYTYTAHSGDGGTGTGTGTRLPSLQINGPDFVDNDGKQFRCWGVNVVAFYPDNETAANFSRNLASRGINCVRWHHMMLPSSGWNPKSNIQALATYEGINEPVPVRVCPDSSNTNSLSPNFTSRIPDAEAWRRFDYLNAELEKQGIYIMLSAHWLRDYGTNDVDIPPYGGSSSDRESWRNAIADMHHRAQCWGYGEIHDTQKMLPVFDERAKALEKEFISTLLNHVNEYTQTAYKNSSQVLTFEVTNEFSSTYTILNGNRYYDTRYHSAFPGLAYFQEKLINKWSAYLQSQGSVYFDLYTLVDGNGGGADSEERERLQVEFLGKLDEDYFADIKSHISGLGGSINLTFSTLYRGETDIKRASQDPENTHTENHIYPNPSVVENVGEDYTYFKANPSEKEDFLYTLAAQSQVKNKPHIIGEINFIDNAEYSDLLVNRKNKRTMQLLAASAYGSLQNWAGVSWFAWNHGDGSVNANGWGENERVPTNMNLDEDRQAVTGNLIEDAITLDHLRTTGTIFKKGLISSSVNPITLYVEDPLYKYVSGYPGKVKVKFAPGWQNVSGIRKSYGPAPAGYNQNAQAFMTAEPTNPVESDTGQISKDVTRRQLVIDAPQVEAFSGYLDNSAPARLDTLEFSDTNGFATVVLVAEDNQPIESSQKLLLSRTYIAGVTNPTNIEQGTEANGSPLSLNGLKSADENKQWHIKYTRPRQQYGQSDFIPVTASSNKLQLPNQNWREAELHLLTDGFTLPHNQWQQIGLPAKPPSNTNTVSNVFANDLGNDYGSDWILFYYDPKSNAYVDPGMNGVLKQGVGYWIIQLTGAAVTLDFPGASTVTPLVSSSNCMSANGCFEISLATAPDDVEWNMVGYPFRSEMMLNRVRVVTSGGACSSGCTLDEAKDANIFHNKLWRYNGEVYNQLGSNSAFIPWSGFWGATLRAAETLAPKLLIPVD